MCGIGRACATGESVIWEWLIPEYPSTEGDEDAINKMGGDIEVWWGCDDGNAVRIIGRKGEREEWIWALGSGNIIVGSCERDNGVTRMWCWFIRVLPSPLYFFPNFFPPLELRADGAGGRWTDVEMEESLMFLFFRSKKSFVCSCFNFMVLLFRLFCVFSV